MNPNSATLVEAAAPEAIAPASARQTTKAGGDNAPAAVRGFVARLNQRLTGSGNATIVWSVGTSFAIFFLTVVQGVILARLLGPEGRGEYGTAVFYTQTLTYIGLLGTQLSIARRAAKGADQIDQLGRASLRLGMLTGLATMLVASILAFVALPAEKAYLAPLCIAAALYLPLEQMRLSILAVDHGSGRFTRYNVHRLLAALCYPCMLLVAWLTGFGSLNQIVALSILVPVFPLALRLFTEPYSLVGPASPAPRALIKEGLPYAAALVASDVLNRLDVFLILWLASFSVQGYYAAAVPAASLLVIAPNTMALFAFNAGARHDRSLGFSKLATVGGAVVGFQLIASLVFAVILGPLVAIVYGAAFRGTVPFAMALLPAFALNGCAMVAEGYLQGRGRATVGIRSRLFGALVMLIFVGLLWGTWREMSIPLAAIAGQAANASWIFWALVREARNNHKLVDPQQTVAR